MPYHKILPAACVQVVACTRALDECFVCYVRAHLLQSSRCINVVFSSPPAFTITALTVACFAPAYRRWSSWFAEHSETLWQSLRVQTFTVW